jgi:hypothetical protein
MSETEKFVDTIIKTIKGAVGKAHVRIDALEQRIADHEARPAGVKYCGVWQAGQDHALGDAVTHKGSLWIAKSYHVHSEPGEDPVCWQLAVKKGRDGRDGKDAR